MIERDIVHENGDFWVSREKPGLYKVWKVGVCASERCAVVSNKRDPAWARERAISECNRRAELAARPPV